MDRKKLTIVERFSDRSETRCGYCKQSAQRFSHGMWAHCMTAADYQDLIDRGWRRSGQYCYKPNNPLTCCPSYTIKCDAKAFHLSKSHKKILKKMNNFLRTGQKSGGSDDAAAAQTSHASGSNASNNRTESANVSADCDIKMNVDQQELQQQSESGVDDDGGGESSALTEMKMITSNQPKIAIDMESVLKVIENAENGKKPSATANAQANHHTKESADGSTASNSHKNGQVKESHKRGAVTGPDPTKPLQPKAKLLRQQRKAEKLLAKANASPAIATAESSPGSEDAGAAASAAAQTTAAELMEKAPKNVEKSLKSFIDEAPTDGKHKLKVKLVSSHSASTEAELNLYRRYQIGIHKDPPEKITRKSFENFLIRSPLQLILVNVESDAFERCKNTEFILYTKYQTQVHHDPPNDLTEFIDFLCNSPIKHETPDDGPNTGYGSFHQQYWLDDKLIAVGVIDILPKCVSSVYFFYDPDLNFLSLGTYGTLREIDFIQDLTSTRPELNEYYMGFYIHTCQKMRYKGKLQPSYLLCPEIYSWHLINDDLLKLLDENKYTRFNLDPQATDLNEFNPAADLNNLRLLVDYKYCLTYRDYKEYKGTEGTDSDLEDFENFSEYGKLVGKVLSRRLYLVT